MLQGIVERRLSSRVPNQSEILIRFQKDLQELVSTTDITISAGEIQFTLPMDFNFSQAIELVELVFELPLLGTTKVIGEIRSLKMGIDFNLNRIIYYGIRFIDVSPITWNYIFDYCQAQAEPENDMEKMVPHNKIHQVRKDFRVEINMMAFFTRVNGPSLTGQVDDISYGGIKAKVPMRFSKDEAVTIQIQFEGNAIKLSGICVWCEALLGEKFPYALGIAFDNLDPANFKTVRNLMFSGGV